jgi:hypothetical protein
LFEHSCTVHIFTKDLVTISLLHQAPWYRGMQAPCNIATLSTLFDFTLPRCLRTRSKCGRFVSRGSSLGSTSTCTLISYTISQASYTSSTIVTLAWINILGVIDESFGPMGSTFDGSTSFSKWHTSMPLFNYGFVFVSCLAFVYQLSSNSYQSLWLLSNSNSKQLVFSIVQQMFLHHCFKYLAHIPLAFVIRTCESNPPKFVSKLLISFPQFFVPPLDMQWVSQNYRSTHIIKWTLIHHSIFTLWFSIRRILENKTKFGVALV